MKAGANPARTGYQPNWPLQLLAPNTCAMNAATTKSETILVMVPPSGLSWTITVTASAEEALKHKP